MVQLGNVGNGPYRTAEKKTSNKEPSIIGMEVESWLEENSDRYMKCAWISCMVDTATGKIREPKEGWRVTLGIDGNCGKLSKSAEHHNLTSAILTAFNAFREEVM